MAPEPADELRRRVTDSYQRYHDELATSRFERFVRFMNYGYVDVEGVRPAPGEAPPVELPKRLPNRNAARLVVELIGDEPIDGRSVIDVGCGRGGAVWLLRTYWQPARVIGVDLTMGAAQAAAGVTPAVRGDAEQLPFATGSTDVVLNIESSLHYPWLERFFGEVARVLRPGGAFLYTDLLLEAAGTGYIDALSRAGFDVERDRDITPNVLASRAERASRESRAFDDSDDTSPDVERFVGADGTAFQQGLADGTWRYRLLRLRRTSRVPEPPLPPSRALTDAVARSTDALGGFEPLDR